MISAQASKDRVPADERGLWDEAAGEAGLGPRVLARSPDALLMAYVEGTELETTLDAAPRLAELHRLQPEIQGSQCSLWRSIDAALDGASSNVVSKVLSGVSLSELHREAATMRQTIETHLGEPDVIFGHGDLKPSNILRSDDTGVLFVDFELAGPNYAFYDVAKLFRDDSTNLCTAFLHAYHDDEPFDVSDALTIVDMFKPISWFEAAVFFLLMASRDPSDEWTRLARDRFTNYRATRDRLSSMRRRPRR